MTAILLRRIGICVMVLVAGLTLTGCGADPTGQLWANVKKEGEALQQRAKFATNENPRRAHRNNAMALERLVNRATEASNEELLGLLEEMLQAEEQLAEGQVSGSEATAIRQRHEEYWSHLREGRLPPGYGEGGE
ncbi:MAG: hypothetical protein WD079_04560 [Phycisphaeraceae bacterium]